MNKRQLIKQYRELARSTSSIDFGCDFDSTGYCKKARKGQESRHNSEYTQNKIKNSDSSYPFACCTSCAGQISHYYKTHTYAHQSREAYNTLVPYKWKKQFSYFTGFWRFGKGCILPRAYRSITCLGCACGMTPKERQKLEIITTKMTNIYRKIFKNYWSY
jgi:hypothetical protein